MVRGGPPGNGGLIKFMTAHRQNGRKEGSFALLHEGKKATFTASAAAAFGLSEHLSVRNRITGSGGGIINREFPLLSINCILRKYYPQESDSYLK